MIHFDTRTYHKCTNRINRGFLKSRLTAWDDGSSTRTSIRPPLDGCNSAHIVDFSDFNIRLWTLAINPIHSHYFAVGGSSPFLYLYDLRMAGGRRCVKRLGPSTFDAPPLSHMAQYAHYDKNVTYCQFNKFNGREVKYITVLLYSSLALICCAVKAARSLGWRSRLSL